MESWALNRSWRIYGHLSWSLSHGPGIAVTSMCGHCRRSLNMTSSAGFPPSVGGSQAGLWFHKMSSGPINRNLTAMLTIDNVLADLIRMPIHIGSLISSFLFQTPGVFTYVARIMPSSSWWQHDQMTPIMMISWYGLSISIDTGARLGCLTIMSQVTIYDHYTQDR